MAQNPAETMLCLTFRKREWANLPLRVGMLAGCVRSEPPFGMTPVALNPKKYASRRAFQLSQALPAHGLPPFGLLTLDRLGCPAESCRVADLAARRLPELRTDETLHLVDVDRPEGLWAQCKPERIVRGSQRPVPFSPKLVSTDVIRTLIPGFGRLLCVFVDIVERCTRNGKQIPGQAWIFFDLFGNVHYQYLGHNP
jgi:hypothetical protein